MPTFLVRRSRPHDKRFVDNYSSFKIFNEASSTIAGTFFGLTLMASKLQTPGDKEKSYCLLHAMLQAMGEDSFILPLMLHEHAGLNLAVARTTDANVVALTWSSGYVDIRPLLEGNLAQSLPGFAGLKERLLCLDPARVHVGTLLTEAFRTKAFWMLRQLLLGVEWVLERRLANEKAGYMVTSALQCLKAVPGKKRRDVDVTFELLSKRMKKSATGEANRWDAAHYAFHAALQAGSSLADGRKQFLMQYMEASRAVLPGPDVEAAHTGLVYCFTCDAGRVGGRNMLFAQACCSNSDVNWWLPPQDPAKALHEKPS